MAIVKKKARTGKIVIDLTGPNGNAFYLLGCAKSFAKQMELDYEVISKEMTSSDYENLITVFDKYFGDVCDLER